MPTWVIAGTPTTQPYPCRCRYDGQCNPKYCPCWGRTDHLDIAPRNCCGPRWTPRPPKGTR
jgi:hypothetical protein